MVSLLVLLAYEVAGDKNVVASPLGLMMLLSLYNAGAGAGAREEINRLLGRQDYKQLFSSYTNLSQEFSRMDPGFMTLANKVYVSDKYTLTDQFVASAKSYRSEVATLNFGNAETAAKVINRWASEKTEGNIASPISADALDPGTAAALFIVIYFNGHWHVPFKAAETKEKKFHVDKKTTVRKPTMHLLQSLYYAESAELGARMVELPYKERGFRMVVVLPNEVDGLPSVLEKAAQKGLLSDVFNLYLSGRDVDLDLPKFNIRSNLDFNDILPKLKDMHSTTKVINRWASDKTEGNIASPISADALDPGTAAALFNVIYFKGHWHVPFKAAETKEKKFHVDKKTTVRKPTMHLLQSLYYAESAELGARMVELPYKERGFRMVVVLPNEVDGLPSVLEKAAQKGLLSDVFNLYLSGRDVDLDLPKFNIRSNLDFNDILPKIGVSKIFNEEAMGIVKGRPITVSQAFQEAFIKVDEEGATAGAFTGLIAVVDSVLSEPLPSLKFTVDHPFLYLILFEDKVLFAGTFSH